MKPYNSIKFWSAVILTVVFLSGCATSQEEIIEPEIVSQDDGGQTGAISDGSSGAEATGVDGSGDSAVIAIDDAGPVTALEILQQAEGALASRVIYFEYDSAKLSDESLAILAEHGDFIAANSEVEVRLEGHTDERGSREYNIALGDRRAQSVRRVLLFQGAAVDQIDTVSYGEEQPVADAYGHDEAAWARNRRVELIYQVN